MIFREFLVAQVAVHAPAHVVHLAAALVAMGPQIRAFGHVLAPGPWGWLRDTVPVFQMIRVTARADQNGAANDSFFYTAADGNHGQSVNSNTVTTTVTVSGGGCVAAGDYLLSNGDRMTTSR